MGLPSRCARNHVSSVKYGKVVELINETFVSMLNRFDIWWPRVSIKLSWDLINQQKPLTETFSWVLWTSKQISGLRMKSQLYFRRNLAFKDV